MQRFSVLVLISALVITSVALPLTQPALAQDRPCLADAQRLCKDLAPDNRNGMMQCLKDHEADLFDACKARMQTFTHEPCVEPGNRLQMAHCLKEHETDLSGACKGRLHSFWGRML